MSPPVASPANSLALALALAARPGLGTEHTGTMICKTLFALCIFTAGISGYYLLGGPRLQFWAGATAGKSYFAPRPE